MTEPSRVAIVSVGNELVFGETVNTNAAWLGRTLSSWGLEVGSGLTVRDRAPEIRWALEQAMSRADVVIVTGGLGPTLDDITKDAVAAHLGVGLVFDPTVQTALEARFRALGRDGVPEVSAGQAWILEGSSALENTEGTAPGILYRREGLAMVLLPGPPREMRAIVEGPLAAAFRALELVGPPAHHRSVYTTGLAESYVAERVEAARSLSPAAFDGVALAYLPDQLGVELRLTATGSEGDEAETRLDAAESFLDSVVEAWRYHAPTGDLAEAVSLELRRVGWRLASAESCTGGLLAQRMTERAGASDVFVGGVVAYDNTVKVGQLGVPPEELARFGAVSEAVARSMAAGAAEQLGAQIAVSITGVAGPGGGSPEKPVGTVWVGVFVEGSVRARRIQCPGDRGAVRRRSAQAALSDVYRALRARAGKP